MTTAAHPRRDHSETLFATPAISADRRADGSIIVKSTIALKESARCVGDWLEYWARETPERIFLGEFGMIKADLGPEAPVDDRASLIAGIRSAAEAKGYAWSVWSHGGSFAITNSDEERVFDPKLLDALGLP